MKVLLVVKLLMLKEVPTEVLQVQQVVENAVPFICTPPIGSYTINLRDPTGAHKLQMEIAVQVPCAQKKGIEDKQAEISHMINMLASDYTVTNLNGLNGRSQLKDEIHVRINKIMQPIKIDNVFFTKFIIN